MSIDSILHQIKRELKDIPGIAGVVLGGSRARGTHHEKSDIDIGIYYDETEGFDIRQLGKIATKLDDKHRENLITPLGGWGPWVNAGELKREVNIFYFSCAREAKPHYRHNSLFLYPSW